MNRVDQHLEHFLGPVARGWATPAEPEGVQVCLFRGRPDADSVVYSTLGLSRHVLRMSDGREVREELVIVLRESFTHETMSNLLFHIAEPVVAQHCALLRGEAICLGYPLSPGSLCKHLYVAMPVVLPDGFSTCTATSPATVFAWLIPITDPELRMIQSAGWGAFEELLESRDVDLLDLNRTSVL